MNDLYTDIGHVSINKFGEQLCGDRVEVISEDNGDVIMVLADGLGSGVKANILSTLTAKIISTMMANGLGVEECISTIALTLPVCEVRKIAYSTFTIILVRDSREAEIYQYDNPDVILLRNGRNVDYPRENVNVDGKKILKTKISLEPGDALIAISDGAIHAGVGMSLNFGWQRDHIIEYMEHHYNRNFTAKTTATLLIDQCAELYGGKPGDDTTVSVMKIRERSQVNLMIGPSSRPEDDEKMMAMFFSQAGKHIICGGTTSGIAAEYLGRSVETRTEYEDPEIPPTAVIQGVDLVTEGVITISKVLFYVKSFTGTNEYDKQWRLNRDGASQVTRMLLEEASEINFFVGRAVNPAHQTVGLPIGFSAKMRLVEELSGCLQKIGKRVSICYF